MKNLRPTGPAGRPYANVQAYILSDGTKRYEANLPFYEANLDGRGRKNSRSLGRFATPEQARRVVLIVQAQLLEQDPKPWKLRRAARYRAESALMKAHFEDKYPEIQVVERAPSG